MTEEKKKEKVIDKIRKLLALSRDPNNEHEAQLALMKAQEFAAKEGLNLDTIDLEKKEKATEEGIEHNTKSVSYAQSAIARVVAPNFRVDYYINYTGRRTNRIVIVGLPRDIEVFKVVYMYAYESYQSLSKIYLKDKKRNYDSYWDRSIAIRSKNDYLKGYVDGLKASFKRNAEEKALVLVIPDAVVEYVDEKDLVPGRAHSISGSGDDRAYLQGYRDGAEFHGKDRISSTQIEQA